MDTSKRLDASTSSNLLLVGEIKTDISLDLYHMYVCCQRVEKE